MLHPPRLSLTLLNDNQQTHNVNRGALLLQETLYTPNPVHKFDLADIVLEMDDSQFNRLRVERHVFLPDALDSAQRDPCFLASPPHLLPFPIIGSETQGRAQLRDSGLDFYRMLSPYLANGSLQLLADEPELCQPFRSPNARKAPRPKRRRALEAKIHAGLKHAASIVDSPIAMEDLLRTKGDWKGRDYRFRLNTHNLRNDWLKGTLGSRLREYEFQEVPYNGRPTWLVDRNGIAYAIRTERLAWLDDAMPPGSTHATYQDRLNWECQEYQHRCGDNTKNAIRNNYRGDHWASTPGVDRQCKQKPNWTKFHRDHKEATDWLLSEGVATRRLIKFAASTLRIRFPIIAARIDRCEQRLLAMGCEPEIAKPSFGLWYNYCINGARPHDSVHGVSCQPHTDAQNLAIMMCALFVYGKSLSTRDFDWHEKAWLVIWEARLIIQLPVGVLFLYPSALFIHFNLNISDFHRHIVTTSHGAYPTPDNSKPVNGVMGRGSIVFFNQASVFQYAELGGTVADTLSQGRPTAANNDEYMDEMLRFDVD